MGIARRFDVIRVEDLNIKGMTRLARGTVEQPGRNVTAKTGEPGDLAVGLGAAGAPEDKAPGRVERCLTVHEPAVLGVRARGRRSRESQARSRCTACGYSPANARTNAARNIAAGHAVKARRGDGASQPVNREPQLLASQRE